MAAMMKTADGGTIRMSVEEYEANIEAARLEGYNEGLAAAVPDADELEADYEEEEFEPEEVEDILDEFPDDYEEEDDDGC
jgi:hypothetical protein